MKIRITFDLDDEQRRAIAQSGGSTSPADYQTCKQYIYDQAVISIDELVIQFGERNLKERRG